MTITDTSGKLIYENSSDLMQSIAWVWKELLVSAASKRKSISTLISDIEHLGIKKDVYGYLHRGDGESSADTISFNFVTHLDVFSRKETAKRS